MGISSIPKMSRTVRLFSFVLALTLLFTMAVPVFAETEDNQGQGRKIEPIEGTYEAYLVKNGDASTNVSEQVIKADKLSFASEDAQAKVLAPGALNDVYESFDEWKENSLQVSGDGYVEFTFDVAADGLYCMDLVYFPIEGKASNIERELYIDGELPFSEAISITFPRIWKNESDEIEQDSRGNDLLVKQLEDPKWVTEPFKDSLGYYDQPFMFRLTQGTHTIRLAAVREPVVIGAIVLRAVEETPTYAQVKDEYAKNGYKPVANIEENVIRIQAELSTNKNSTALAPVYDRSSPLVEPYDAAALKLNVIGTGRWKMAGQWVEYEVEAPETGLYNISLKVKQNIARGLIVTRKLYIDGKLPFKEAGEFTYPYSTKWKMDTLGNDEEDFQFYFEKGKKHTIRLEASLGELAYFCRVVTDSVNVLNSCYRKVVTITGPNPDVNRDYRFDRLIPDVIETFNDQSEILYEISRKMQEYTGGTSSYTAILDTLAYQMNQIYKRPDSLARRLKAFKDNLTSLGAWVLNVRESDLSMDYILITPVDYEEPRAQHNIWEAVMHHVNTFVASFFMDYNSVGNINTGDKNITVWINGGREQAQVLKSLVDSIFTPKNGIGVNVKLVQGALLQATVSGKAPDVALSVGGGDPVNYAIRNAVIDLTQFPDFDEVRKRFHPAALTPLTFDGKVYGLPERINFHMLFYREDILEEIGVEVPKTWDEIYRILPILQQYNMEMGIQTSDVTTGNMSGFNSFGMFLYQRDGDFYTADHSRAAFDSEEAIEAMRQWTDFYINRGQPVQFDFATRFRSGEMPLAIVDYTNYNLLTGFAPEIRNVWSFTIVPGTPQEDGTINSTVASTVAPCMIMKSTKYPEEAWEFLKWWTEADTQIAFGREIESLQGEMGRYPTANMEAISKLPWPTKDYNSLMQQFEQIKGIPEVPGGYYAWRHVDNAFRQIYNRNIDAREVMYDYNYIINREVIHKRREFGLE